MTVRRWITAAIVVMAASTILWATWTLDSPAQRAEEGRDTEFVYQMPAESAHAHGDVLIGCNEEVIDDPTEKFIKWKGLEGIPLEFPGGPMSIAPLRSIEASENLKPMQRAAIEVLKRYSPERIVLVSHEMCLYYDTLAAWQNSLEKVRERQANDMNAAVALLREWFPRAEVTGYMAEEKDRKIHFRQVSK